MTRKKAKPLIYVMSPYTRGDQDCNVHFQCWVFDVLRKAGLVTPIVPLWAYFQHLLFPHDYEFWTKYDNEIIHSCDAGLRLPADLTNLGQNYRQEESSGADAEAKLFLNLDRPVFHSIPALHDWAREWRPGIDAI